MDGSQHLAIAENIALLSLLTRTPEAPAQNPAMGDLECNGQKGRTLTFERERDIVDNLAFYLLPRIIRRRSQLFASRSMQMHAGVLSG